MVTRAPSVDEQEKNITIRLSDLGVIRRSPSELDLQIHDDKIDCVLENTIKKLKMAVCLPRLLRNDACQLYRFMDPEDVEFIVTVANKYDIQYCSFKNTSFAVAISSMDRISKNESKMSKRRYRSRGEENDIDPHMGKVLEMLWKNQQLREMVLTEFQLIKPNSCTVIVDHISSLKEIVLDKLNTTALEERSRERHIRQAWNSNSLLEQKIQKMQALVEDQRQTMQSQLQIKKNIVLKHETEIEYLKQKFKDDVKYIIQDSEKDMEDEIEFSTQRQVELSAESKATTLQYEGLLTQHMGIEKMLRAKRYKVEAQLCSWLAKFDADIGERQAEFDTVNGGYLEEKAIVEGILNSIDEQDEEYQILWDQKEEEEQLMWEERAYEYLRNRSARKIQRCWRAYVQRKIDRKKAKRAKALAKLQKKLDKAARKEEEAAEGGGEKKKKEKGKGKGKEKGKGKKEVVPQSADGRGPDFQAALDKKFGGDLLEDLQGEGFSKKEVVVDLAADLEL